MIQDSITSHDARNQWSDVINNVLTKGQQIITRYGKPLVVLVRYNEYQRFQKAEQELRNRIGDMKIAALRNSSREPFTRQELKALFNEDATRE